jgi:hypothetical protein
MAGERAKGGVEMFARRTGRRTDGDGEVGEEGDEEEEEFDLFGE